MSMDITKFCWLGGTVWKMCMRNVGVSWRQKGWGLNSSLKFPVSEISEVGPRWESLIMLHVQEGWSDSGWPVTLEALAYSWEGYPWLSPVFSQVYWEPTQRAWFLVQESQSLWILHNYEKFYPSFPKARSLLIKQTVIYNSYRLSECSQLLNHLQPASSLFGVVWGIERFLKSGMGNGKNSVFGGQRKLGNHSFHITEKNTGLVLWPLVS